VYSLSFSFLSSSFSLFSLSGESKRSFGSPSNLSFFLFETSVLQFSNLFNLFKIDVGGSAAFDVLESESGESCSGVTTNGYGLLKAGTWKSVMEFTYTYGSVLQPRGTFADDDDCKHRLRIFSAVRKGDAYAADWYC